MRILSFSEYIDEGKKNPLRTVFSIGVFDGVHFGHKAILEDLRRLKKKSGAECSAVFTFISLVSVPMPPFYHIY